MIYYRFEKETNAEKDAKRFCRNLTSCFQDTDQRPYKIITGMGNSIGHFISGPIKERCRNTQNKNVDRYLQMEPFPFTGAEDSDRHRHNMIEKAGVVIFIYGDMSNDSDLERSGMFKEYQIAKENTDTVIIPIPCGSSTISSRIFDVEKKCDGSFASEYSEFLMDFDPGNLRDGFFEDLYKKVNDITSSKLKEKTKALCNVLND